MCRAAERAVARYLVDVAPPAYRVAGWMSPVTAAGVEAERRVFVAYERDRRTRDRSGPARFPGASLLTVDG